MAREEGKIIFGEGDPKSTSHVLEDICTQFVRMSGFATLLIIFVCSKATLSSVVITPKFLTNFEHINNAVIIKGKCKSNFTIHIIRESSTKEEYISSMKDGSYGVSTYYTR